MEYLDRSLGQFIRGLEDAGVLEDTLVLITSDESRELAAGGSDFINALLQAWGVMVVLHPSGAAGMVGEPGLQLDVPISVLDGLGMPVPASGFAGRSLFRRYPEPRQLLWGNIHLGVIGGLSTEGELALCTEDGSRCVAAAGAGVLFPPPELLRPVESSQLGWLLEGAHRSLGAAAARPATRELVLANPGTLEVGGAAGEPIVFGGQFFAIPRDTRADVEVRVSLEGEQGSLLFHHDLVLERRQQYSRTGRMEAGETVTIRYTVRTQSPVADAECRFWVTEVEGEGLVLRIRSARISLSESELEVVAPGVTEHAFVVDQTPPGRS
jgi:hypothetical protein